MTSRPTPFTTVRSVLLGTAVTVVFVAAVGMLGLSAWYLYRFVSITSNVVNQPELVSNDTALLTYGRMVFARFALLSCGVSAGMSFGLLGFSLLLMQIKGNTDVRATGGSYELNITNLSPGAFLILCASGLIGVCVTQQASFEWQTPPAQIEAATSTDLLRYQADVSRP